jgi:hypothetical protein
MEINIKDLKMKKVILLFSLFVFTINSHAGEKKKPLMKDFMGINGHFKFKPELYSKNCRLVRNYHNINWDVKNPGDKATLPVCVNKVNWIKNCYGSWKKYDFETSICVSFGTFGHKNKNYKKLWLGKDKGLYNYGYDLAKFFGPSGKHKICTSIEIGNEPGQRFDDKLYKMIFKNMAEGIRKGDKKVKIVTCTAHSRTADDYSKNLDETFNDPAIKKLYDVINIHTYAQIKRKNNSESPWNRSYPEAPDIDYLKVVDETIDWRNKNARDKEIWVTEFGYDACTADVMKQRKGWMKKLDWQGVSDLMQAQYLVRSLLVFAERDIDRAYIYFYDDSNKPGVHASAGLTRNFKPKMSYWAVKHLYETLGDYRFSKVIKKEPKKLYVYEFINGTNAKKKIWVAWSPTGAQSNTKDNYKPRKVESNLTKLPGKPYDVVEMPIQDGPAPKIKWSQAGNKDSIKLKIGESPVYIMMK